MGIFDSVEKKIESAVNGVFAKAFKGEVQPVEIAARLTRELDANSKVLSRGKRLVPNRFVVGLSPTDYERLAPFSKTLNTEIIPELREHANERNYVFNGPISIDYVENSDLSTGRFVIDAQASPLDGPEGSAAVRRNTNLVIEVNGVRHNLQPPGLVIGRGSEANLRINDPGISRKHARITVVEVSDGYDLTLDDLGSTNGVIVDGEKVTHTELRDGSRIEMGSTRMLVHSTRGAWASE